MDTRRFDDVARLLARGGNRRQALKLAIAGGMAGFAGRRHAAAAAAPAAARQASPTPSARSA